MAVEGEIPNIHHQSMEMEVSKAMKRRMWVLEMELARKEISS